MFRCFAKHVRNGPFREASETTLLHETEKRVSQNVSRKRSVKKPM
jgi:hypothetical protein